MASTNREGMPQRDFSLLKLLVSGYFDDRKLLGMLKVLYRDIVRDQKLSKITCTIDLLNALVETDELSSNNLTLLYDTINLTEQFSLQLKLKEKLPYFQDVRGEPITTLKSHRQKLVRFGLEVTVSDVSKIDGLYNTPLTNYEDSWAMIRDLEYKQILTTSTMDSFIEGLDKIDLKQAVRTLRGGPPTTASDTPNSDEPRPLISDIRQTPVNATNTNVPIWAMKELTSAEFSQLLVNASTRWKRFKKITMFKVLLCDFENIGTNEIQEAKGVYDLLMLLRASGAISRKKILVLIEAAVLCGVDSVEELIKTLRETCPAFEEVKIKIFSQFRQNVVKFGNMVTIDKLETIYRLYNIDSDDKDKWDLIFGLERIRNILTKENKDFFVQKLEYYDKTSGDEHPTFQAEIAALKKV